MRSHFLRALQKGSATPTDPNFNQVALLLHGDGTNGSQNNTFLDSSTNNLTITRTGNTAQGTYSPFSLPDGQWSNFFDGAGDRFQIANNAALQVSSSDFTLETWVYLTALPASGSLSTIAQKGLTSTSNYEISFRFNNTAGVYTLELGTTANGTTISVASSSSLSLTANTWHHCAVTKTGTTATLWFNGVSVGTGTVNSTIISGSADFCIGDNSSGNRPITGYLSNLRLVKGSLVYTSNFTPSTVPLTAITNTSLLTCQSNRFKDNSSNNFTLTPNGNVQVTAFSPFAPTSAYSPSVNGGSGYFDGNGDYLSAPADSATTFGTGTFTIEFWYRANRNPSGTVQLGVVSKGTSALSTNWQLVQLSDGKLRFLYNSSTSFTCSTSLNINTWYHVALVGNSTSIIVYINGVQDGSVTYSYNYSESSVLRVGVNRPTSNYFNGYISSLRVLKGTALYTSTFTPPTAPLTDITNTSLLLNFTNAGIFDSSAKQNLETLGNAQISTSVTKFGTGSMAFDGSGDYLRVAGTSSLNIGTSNFTIEGWAYNTTVAQKGLFQLSSTGLNTSFTATLGLLYSSTEWEVYGGGASNKVTVTPTFNSWFHFAVVRSSGTTKLYIDGVSIMSFADTYNYNYQTLAIGGAYSTGFLHTGYIDDFRITNGVARYTADFTPPTAPYPDL
jgi:hypothetical protein